MKIFASILACSCVGFVFFATADEQRLKTRFVPKGELTTNETKIIIELAHRAGIKEVEEIYTDYIFPANEFYIGGKEKETRNGRRVIYRRFFINKVGWSHYIAPDSDKIIKIGDFSMGRIDYHELTILKVKNAEFKIDLKDGISPETAERILANFQSGKFSFKSRALNEKIHGIDFSNPSSLTQTIEDRSMCMVFGSKRDKLEVFSIRFTIKKDRIQIIEVMCVIA